MSLDVRSPSRSPSRNAEELPTDGDEQPMDREGTMSPVPQVDGSLENIVHIAQPLGRHGGMRRSQSIGNATAPPEHVSAYLMGASQPNSPSTTLSGDEQRLRPSIQSFLCNVPHLSALPNDIIQGLKVMVREFDALDVVLDEGATVQHVYVLASGTVEVFAPRNKKNMIVGHRRVGSITAPGLFGIDSIVFDTVTDCSYHAGSANTSILLISKAQFLALFARSIVFSESIGNRLTESLPAFGAFRDFCRSLFAQTLTGHGEGGYTLHMPSIIESYMKIQPKFHQGMDSPTIDVNAWHYASNRLPRNITETFVINVVRAMPPFLAIELKQGGNGDTTEDFSNASFVRNMSTENSAITFVLTSNRRRSSWQIGERGHLLTIARDGFTDVLDLTTNLCAHIIEAKKLRIRLQTMITPSAVEVLREALAKASGMHTEEAIQLQDEVLHMLPLSRSERIGISQMWPTDAVQRLYNVVMHNEQYIFRLDNSISKRFEADPFVHWGIVIRRHILRMIGVDEHCTSLPEHVTVDILCCNSYVAKNLLSVRLSRYEERLRSFAAAGKRSEVFDGAWNNHSDPLYYLISKMVTEDDTVREEMRQELISNGFTVLEDSTASGLQVDIIDVNKIKLDSIDSALIPALSNRSTIKRRFIVNVDYLFGAQTDGFLRALFLTLGKRIRSVNLISKAAALVGNRGDILLPSQLLFAKAALSDDSVDEVRATGNEDVSLDRIRELAGPNKGLHTGTVITIPGIILQNAPLLKFYKVVYGCSGLEMEGSYCARQVEESSALGLIQNVRTRFAYFFSDMPLGNSSGVASTSKTKPIDVVASSYALGRAFLELMLKD